MLLACDCTIGRGLPRVERGYGRYRMGRGYAAACRILRNGDTWVDGGCAEAHDAVAVRDHLRDAHGISVGVTGIDMIPTERLFRALLRPEYAGVMDHGAMTEAAVRSRGALDRFIVCDIRDADVPEGCADVVTCFHLGSGRDSERAAHVRLAGFLGEGGAAVFSVHRPNRAADIMHGNTRLNGMLRRRLLSGPLSPARDRWHVFCSTHGLNISVYGFLRPALDRWRPLRRALRTIEIRVMIKAEALEHAAGCDPPCAHGEMVDFY